MLLSLVVRTHARSARLRGCLRAHGSLYIGGEQRRGRLLLARPPFEEAQKRGPQVHLCSAPRLYVAGIFADSYPLLDTTRLCPRLCPIIGYIYGSLFNRSVSNSGGAVDPEGRISYCD